jgi:hypothetical protein
MAVVASSKLFLESAVVEASSFLVVLMAVVASSKLFLESAVVEASSFLVISMAVVSMAVNLMAVVASSK